MEGFYQRFLSILLMVLLPVWVQAGTTVYKYRDGEGHILFTDNPRLGHRMTLLKRFHFSYEKPRSGGRAPSLAKIKARIRKYSPYIASAARRYHLDPDLIHAVILAESAYQPRARSPKGAIGLMQLMPQTARRLGVNNPWDPKQNIRGGAAYLRSLLDRYQGDLKLALAAYNAGENAVERYGKVVPPYKETMLFVKKVKEFMDKGMVAFLD